jgi:hypothetical protein
VLPTTLLEEVTGKIVFVQALHDHDDWPVLLVIRAFPEKTESKRISVLRRIRFKNPTGTEASMGWESHIRRICVIG